MPAIHRCLSALAALLLVASTAHAQASKVPKAGAVCTATSPARAASWSTRPSSTSSSAAAARSTSRRSARCRRSTLAQGRVDLVGTARMADPDNPFERDLVFTPVAWDAIVLVTSTKKPVAALSLEQIVDIYLGRVTDWSALGGAPKPINLYAVAGPDDGVEFSMRQLVLGNGNR